MKVGFSLVLIVSTILACVVALSGCDGCRPSTPTSPDGAAAESPTARLYLVSDLAGALEPCGCVKDQLGGVDRFGALVNAERARAPAYATLAAGPLFFMDMELEPDKRSQEIAKAETLAKAMKLVKLEAFAPGRNEWAAGASTLSALEQHGAAMLAANVRAEDQPLTSSKLVSVGAIQLGVIGVAAPETARGVRAPLDDVASSPPAPEVKRAVAALKSKGAHAIIVLAAVGRGEAKRIADDNPEVTAILVGSTGASGDGNTKAAPPEQIGDVLIVETANHLQTVGVLDLHLRDAPSGDLVRFADATGVERMRKRAELLGRIDELRSRIATWERDKNVPPGDIQARRADVARLEASLAALDEVPAPARGSFYRFSMRDIREELGADAAMQSEMLAFYKKVNEDNKIAFKDKKPLPAADGQPSYIGVATCSECHEHAKKVWDGTAHARAYATLERQFKEANLDCVGCHVTGYDKPGGSTVTHVADLKDVQCEVCHGPGSLHAAAPDKFRIPIATPTPESCIECHHPPHVHAFDAKMKMVDVLGPGHGLPLPR